MESRLFILTEVNKITNSSGHLVKADMGHFRLLNEWAKQFHVEVRLDVEDDYIRKLQIPANCYAKLRAL